MENLASLGLKTRVTKGNSPGEMRIEMRFMSNDSFIAWFKKNVRESNGERITSVSSQFVRRTELNRAQILAVKAWLLRHIREHV